MDKTPRKKSPKKIFSSPKLQKSKTSNLKRLESTKKAKSIPEIETNSKVSTTGTKAQLSSVIVRPKRKIQFAKLPSQQKSRFSPRFRPPAVSSNYTTSSEESEPTTNLVPIQKRLRNYSDSSSDTEGEQVPTSSSKVTFLERHFCATLYSHFHTSCFS